MTTFTCKEPLEKEQVVAQPDNHLMTPDDPIIPGGASAEAKIRYRTH